jgi:PAS domain S-box-containing protein
MKTLFPRGGFDGESESFFRTLAEKIPQMVWTKDANGINDYCNRRFREYMNLTVDEFVHNSWIVAHPDDAGRGQSVWKVAKERGAPYEVELRLRPKHSLEYRWFLVRAVPYRDRSGQVIKWFGTTTDIDDQKRYAQQHEEAVRVLSELFSPQDLPVLASLSLDALYVPAEHLAKVGGDFYETFVLPDGRLLVAIGDVAGHGLAAAMIMERVRNAIVMSSIDSDDPSWILKKVNRVLALRSQASFVTALVGVIDPRAGTFTYASAGHHGPVLAEPEREAGSLPTGGVPLGVSDDPDFPTFLSAIAPNATLVLYTDGLTEFNRDIEDGERRLLAAAARVVRSGETRPAHAIQCEVLAGAQPIDDVALLTITFRGASGSPA